MFHSSFGHQRHSSYVFFSRSLPVPTSIWETNVVLMYYAQLPRRCSGLGFSVPLDQADLPVGLTADLRSGAMSSGVHGCPPRQVAEEVQTILFDEKFVGWFKEVVFVVYPARQTGEINYDVFKDVIEAPKS